MGLTLDTAEGSISEPKDFAIETPDSNIKWGLPCWCSGWESACQCRGHRFEPWSGKIPRASAQLSPCATATEPAL